MLPISICIIAKNEEKHLAECLKRAKLFHYEIVLADTGSTDSTKEIASRYTDNIYHFTWNDDFSAAKNFAVSKASNDWILTLDCDEYLESIDEEHLSRLMEQYPESAGRILLRNRFTENGQTSVEQVRVSRFFNRTCYHFTGAVHEQLERLPESGSEDRSHSADRLPDSQAAVKTAALRKPVRTFTAPITALHVGYDCSEAEMRAKAERNLSLLEKELAVTGPDSYLYYQLGQCCMKLKDFKKAREWFDLGLSMDVDPGQDYVKDMVDAYGYCLLDLKCYPEALQLEGIYDVFCVRADFVFLMGLIYMNNGLFPEAVEEFKKSTTIEEFSVEGINSYRAFYNIGVIYECTGQLDEARKYYRKCGEFETAKMRLREIGG